ncbi:MAG: hypothetical protein ACJAQT_000858 [Akkermansiaceae bacterium]
MPERLVQSAGQRLFFPLLIARDWFRISGIAKVSRKFVQG